MTIQKALRKLFTKMGGAAATVKNKGIAGIINEMAELDGESGGSESGGGVMVVTFSAAMEDNELVITADKTLSELLEALEGGMICEGRLATAEATTILRTLDYTEESIRFYFKDNDDVTWVQIAYGADGISYDGGSGGEE